MKTLLTFVCSIAVAFVIGLLAWSTTPAQAQIPVGYTGCGVWTSGELIYKAGASYSPKKASGTGEATVCIKNGELYVLAYTGAINNLSMVRVTLPEVP